VKTIYLTKIAFNPHIQDKKNNINQTLNFFLGIIRRSIEKDVIINYIISLVS